MNRLASFVLLALAGCATTKTKPPNWLPATSPWVAPVGQFQVDLPDGWMRGNITDRELLLVTRDGTALQRIFAGSSEVGKPFGGTQRTVVAGMTPEQAGSLVIDDLNSSKGWTDIRVLANEPATLSGRPGFRLLAAYKDKDGLKNRLVVYGLVSEPRFYWLVYLAPERHYFDLYLPSFEWMVKSFRLNVPPPST